MEILGKYREGRKVISSEIAKWRNGENNFAFRFSLFAFHFSLILAFSLNAFAQTSYTVQQDAFSKSYSYESRGNFTDAITAMKTVYQEDSYEINLRLGWVEYLAGQFTESSAYYQKAIKLKPYAIEAKIGFANPASALGNWDQVITQYNDVLAIDPQNTIVNYRMGSIYYGRKDYAKAEKFLEKVVNLYAFDYDSMVLYAWTEYRLGKLREAQVLFNKALLMRPKDASATEGLGLIK
ncbi:MAG: tetratricopeptide repeat protein [Bacteroidota bacterium]|jgi:tetratricopeptide (TPR) repeat protein